MTVKVILPKSGMGIVEGAVVSWLKEIGDPVMRVEPLTETTNAIHELRSPAPGETVLVNITLAEIGEAAAVTK